MWTEVNEKPLPAQVGPAVGLALGVTLLAELVALLIGHDHQADADTHGREDEDKYPAFKGLNHARARAGGLGVAERTSLAPGGQREAPEDKQQESGLGDGCDSNVHIPPHRCPILPGSVRAHVEQPDAVGPDHVHHEQDEDRVRDQGQSQHLTFLREVHEIHHGNGRLQDGQHEHQHRLRTGHHGEADLVNGDRHNCDIHNVGRRHAV